MKFTFRRNVHTLRDKLTIRAPIQYKRGPGEYRRIPGYSDDGEEYEEKGYHSVLCIIQAGLESEKTMITKILSAVVHVQGGGAGNWSAIVMVLESTSMLRVHPVALRDEFTTMGASRRWGEIVCQLSGSEYPERLPLVVKEFFPESAINVIPRKRRVGRGDLILILARKDELRFAQELSPQLRTLRKHVVVAEIMDNDTAIISMDRFEDLVESAIA